MLPKWPRSYSRKRRLMSHRYDELRPPGLLGDAVGGLVLISAESYASPRVGRETAAFPHASLRSFAVDPSIAAYDKQPLGPRG